MINHIKKFYKLYLFAILIVFQLYVFFTVLNNGLSKGVIIKMKIGLRDPYDPIKGRYLALTFDEERRSFKDFPDLKDKLTPNENKTLYCIVSPGDNKITKITLEMPYDNSTFFKAKLAYPYENYFVMDFPFNKYYIQENYALDAEKIIGDRSVDSELIISVDADGKTKIKKLLVNGEEIEKYIKKHR